MKTPRLLALFALLATTPLLPFASAATPTAAAKAVGREKILLDTDWRFALGHATDPAKDFNHATGYFSYLTKTGYGDGPASPAFDDRGWRVVKVPHDWAVEMPFDPKASYSHGFRSVGPRFPENSVGWYRQSIRIPAEDLGRRIRVTLDGAYRNARVFINGFYVGEEPSGYLPATYDLTDYLRYGEDNILSVRVDASMEEGWYYEGAGIYRHVWLTKTEPVRLVEDGTWIRTEVSGADARADIDTEVVNEGREARSITVTQTILAPDGRALGSHKAATATLAPGGKLTTTHAIALTQVRLWSLEDPALHTLVTEVRSGDVVLDRIQTKFGVRSVRFDPDAGFFLNGKKVVLKGTNNHQDHAGIGVALPDALQEYRLRRLKAMGSNAYRTSHHPPTRELLEACDRLGMLVIDETRLMGINTYHLSQLERLIRRDRNHPSVILWSIGNEEWAIEGNIFGARITTTMQDFARRLDPTRLTTVAISGGWGGSSTTIDVMGVNYIRHGDLDKQHAAFPKQVIVGTEETTTQQTRGIYFRDDAKCHLAPLEDGSSGGNCESGWKHYVARPWTAGVFYWTGFDYRGEPTPFGWPAIGSQFGILDTCGFAKDSFYYLKSWWSNEPVLHLLPHWNWPGREGQEIEVRAHSNCDEVELFLNGKSLGRQSMPVNGHLAWKVAYAPGKLTAHGYRKGVHTETTEVQTTGPVAGVTLAPDRSILEAGKTDATVVTVAAVDSEGRVVPTGAVLTHFSLKGPGRLLGVGNGDPSSLEDDTFVESVKVIPLGVWNAPDAAPSPGGNEYRVTFDRPKLETQDVTLLLNALGPNQTVTLNGKALYEKAAPTVARASLALRLSDLRETGNELVITSEKYASWGDRETLKNFHPASLRYGVPAPAWKRTTFNGLAQVILESDGTPGTLELTATPATGAPVMVKIEVR